MNQITNTTPRRISMAYFTGLFLLTLAVPCIAFIQSAKLSSSLPAKEVSELKEKERITKLLADLGDALRSYETAQTTKDLKANQLASEAKMKMENLYRELSSKDISTGYKDISRSLAMANQYYTFIQTSSLKGLDVNPLLQQLQAENQRLNMSLIAAQSAGGAKPCPPCPVCPPSSGGGGGCPPCPTAQAPPPCNCEHECNTKATEKINEYKNKINPMITLMSGNLNSIRNDVNRMSFLWVKHTSEKQNIDRNLKDLETTFLKIQSQ